MNSFQSEEGLPAQLHLEASPEPYQREVSELQYHGDAAVDVVLVHGLGSKYATTWAHKRKDGTRYRWIQERLAKDIPDARILGFEYPSRWYSDPVHTDLTECASQLLRSLIDDRCDGGAKINRRIAMVMAGERMRSNSTPAMYENSRDLLCAIAGVIFLGTPHRGTSYTLLARAKMWYGDEVVQVSSNNAIINVLMPDSYALTDLQRQFAQLYDDKRMSGLQLACYYEMREVSTLLSSGPFGLLTQEKLRLVVPWESAVLDGWPDHGVDANHLEMNTFYDGDDNQRDPNYAPFLLDIRNMIQQSREVVPGRFNRWTYGSVSANAEREQIQRWLGTSESRQAQQTAYLNNLKIQESAPYTCQWVHETTEFRSWLMNDITGTNTLWITGTAGSGKSVLAAYIINYLSANGSNGGPWNDAHNGGEEQHPAVLHFFCGMDRMMETPTRMLSVLIHQLLAAQAEDDELFDLVRRVHRSSLSSGASAATLASALGAMKSRVRGTMFIIIDNLEDIDDPVGVLEALAPLQHRTDIRFLFSSQDVAKIAKALHDGFGVANPLLITDHSAADVESFVRVEADAIFREKPKLQEKRDIVIQTLTQGACGVFQWVNSAVHHLADVEDPEDVQGVLDDISPDLLTTYDKAFDRLASKPGPTTLSRLRACLKVLAAAARPVTCADVKMAFLVQDLLDKGQFKEDDLRNLFDRSSSKTRSQVAEREVLSYLETLVTVLPDGTIQFRHPTILRALGRVGHQSGNDERKPSMADEIKFSPEDAHLAMARICMAICRVTAFTHANAFDEWQVPLVQYAWCYWAHHLKKSETGFQSVSERAQARATSTSNGSPERKGPESTQTLFDKMMESVSRDALIYLDSLIAFLVRPLKAVPGIFSDRDYVLSLLRAQESLLQPAQELCSLRRSMFESLSSSLHDARRDVISESKREVPDLSTQALIKVRAEDAFTYTKSKVLGLESVIRRLRADNFLRRKPEIKRPTGTQKQLFEIARALRVTTLRFAVDPIYSALLTDAGGSSFSPLHPLVYLAQLIEEAATYPYWEALPPGSDPLAPFICQSNDREYAAAKFVLHCFEWRDPRQSEATAKSPTTENQVGRYRMEHLSWAPARSLDDGRPSHSFQALMRVTTENWEQVQRLHEPSSKHWYTAMLQYSYFRTRDSDFFGKMIVNPMTNMHMKYQLMIDHDSEDSMFEDSTIILGRHAPTEVRETPFKAYIRSLPSLLRVIFHQYILDLMRIFGQLARSSFQWHFVKIDMAKNDLGRAKAFLRRVYRPNENPDLPRVPLIYFLPATVLFVLRCRYLPSWGSFIWFHSWWQFPYAYRHAAMYLDLQNDFGFWDLARNTSMYLIDAFVGAIALIWTCTPVIAESRLGKMGFIVGIFHLQCAVERSLFSLASVLATVIACSRIIFYDAENVAALFKWSMWMWVLIFLQLLIAGVQCALTEYTMGSASITRGVLLVFGFPLLQIALLYLFSRHFLTIGGALYKLAKPARIAAIFVWKYFMFASVLAAKALGTIILLIAVFKAFDSLHTFAQDPYDTRRNTQKLLQASEHIHRSQNLPSSAFKRIGHYPFGSELGADCSASDQKCIQERSGAAGILHGFGRLSKEPDGPGTLPALRFGATQAIRDPL